MVVVVVVFVVVVVVVVVLGGAGAPELTSVAGGIEGSCSVGGCDGPGGGGVATIGPTSWTSQLQSQPHSTGSCSPAWPRAAVRSATDPLGSFGCFGLFFLLRLLPGTGS